MRKARHFRRYTARSGSVGTAGGTRLLPTFWRGAGGASNPWERHICATGSYGCTSCAENDTHRRESGKVMARQRRKGARGGGRRGRGAGGKDGHDRRGASGGRAPSSGVAAGSSAAPGPARRHPPSETHPLRRRRRRHAASHLQRSRASSRAQRRPAPSAAAGAACVAGKPQPGPNQRRAPSAEGAHPRTRCKKKVRCVTDWGTHRCARSSVRAQRSRGGAVGAARPPGGAAAGNERAWRALADAWLVAAFDARTQLWRHHRWRCDMRHRLAPRAASD